MKHRRTVLVTLALVVVGAILGWLYRSEPRPNPQAQGRAVERLSVEALEVSRDCQLLVQELEAALPRPAKNDLTSAHRWVERAATYSGLPRASRDAWGLAEKGIRQNPAGTADWSHAWAPTDCHFPRYARAIQKASAALDSMNAPNDLRRTLGRHWIRLTSGAAHQALPSSVWSSILTTTSDLLARGYLESPDEDRAQLRQEQERFAIAAARFAERRRELQDRLFRAPSFDALDEPTRSAIGARLGAELKGVLESQQRLGPLWTRLRPLP